MSRGLVATDARLSHGIGPVEKKDGDLLVRLLADIDPAVNTVGRLIPACFPGGDLESMALTTNAVFDREGIATQDHRYPMKWVAVPRHGLAGTETQPTHQRCSPPEEFLLSHSMARSSQPLSTNRPR
jgi:hypothetical protein